MLQFNTVHHTSFTLQRRYNNHYCLQNIKSTFDYNNIIFFIFQKGIMLGNFQFLYFDFILTTSLAIVMGDIEPTDKVHPHRPLSKILTAKNLIPLFLQLLVCALIQIGSLYYLELQDW